MSNQDTMDTKQQLMELQEQVEQRGEEAIEELRTEDPALYLMLMAEAAQLLEDDDVEDDDAVPTMSVEPYQAVAESGESESKVVARCLLKPELLASTSITSLTQFTGHQTTLTDLVGEIETQTAAMKRGDISNAMLGAQSQTLEALFHRLVKKGMRNIEAGYGECGREYLKLALKAQSQCRDTLNSISAMNRPVIKQTNIAHGHQQVNNIQNPPNELLDSQNERMDEGATTETVEADSEVETLAEIDRPSDRQGERD